MAKKQLTVFVTFVVAPADIPAFKDAHRLVWAACAAEPECLLFDVFQDPETPGRFRFVEVWSEGREWFETKQMTKPYYATLWEKVKPLWLEPAKIEFFEREGEGASIARRIWLVGRKWIECTVPWLCTSHCRGVIQGTEQ